ncbi:Ku protein [Streptomyces sp. NPDC087270]|uniref:Ku protein n=1 Tax=Streptomyces sp. NPDC087270 TaxID=3365774 RepID=UPI00380E0A7E
MDRAAHLPPPPVGASAVAVAVVGAATALPGVYSPSPSPASRVPLPARKVIDIVGFVDAGDVDLLLYGCYAAPDGPAAIRPYALLGEALARAGAFGAAKPAVRTRERLAVPRPRRGVLVIQALRWSQEIRDPADIASPAPVTDRELGLAEALVE